MDSKFFASNESIACPDPTRGRLMPEGLFGCLKSFVVSVRLQVLANFRSRQASYSSRVLDAGANLKEAMLLARHSDPRLTMKTYARVGLVSLSRVLDNMPGTECKPAHEAKQAKATGTDDDHCFAPAPTPAVAHQFWRELKLTGAHGRDEFARDGTLESVHNPGDHENLRTSAHSHASEHTERPRQDSNLRPPRSKHGALSS